jgi:hypothetical protein
MPPDQNGNSNPPVPEPVTCGKPRCFTDQKLADQAAKDCPAGTHPFLWVKQGMWKNGKPTLGEGEQITNPQDLGSWYKDAEGGFNYISDIGDYYIGADAGASSTREGINYLKICPKKAGWPLVGRGDLPAQDKLKPGEISTMYCVTCLKNT